MRHFSPIGFQTGLGTFLQKVLFYSPLQNKTFSTQSERPPKWTRRGFRGTNGVYWAHLTLKCVCQHKTGPKLGENGWKRVKRDETHFYRIDPVFVQIDARQKQGHLITLSVHSRPLFVQSRAISPFSPHFSSISSISANSDPIFNPLWWVDRWLMVRWLKGLRTLTVFKQPRPRILRTCQNLVETDHFFAHFRPIHGLRSGSRSILSILPLDPDLTSRSDILSWTRSYL